MTGVRTTERDDHRFETPSKQCTDRRYCRSRGGGL